LANRGQIDVETAGAFIRRVRQARGLSLRQFAKLVGISPTYLSHIEVDHAPPPGPDKLDAIARELSVDPGELLLLAGKWGERAAEALDSRKELRELFELVFAMEEREVRTLVEEIAARQDVPREIGGLF
jgi:transcriptional regulator with XRE-family HTH domain